MDIKLKYALYGFAFGAFFPFGATVFELIIHHLSFSFSSLGYIHKNNPLLFIIDSAPVWLGIFAFFGGIQQAKSQKLLDQFSYISSILKKSSNKLDTNSKTAFNNMQSEIKALCQRTNDMKSANEIINSVISQSNTNINNLSQMAEKMISSTCELVASNKATRRNNTLISENILEFLSYFEQIVNETRQIKSIGKQINILAVNSGIEANKLGEQGKGFAVIARNIKELAEKTALTNSTIEDKVNTSITDAETIKSNIINEQKNLDIILNLSKVIVDEINEFKQTIKEVVTHIR